MKKLTRSTTLLFPVFLILTALVQEASAQCVQCKATGGAFNCVPSTNGGCQCATVGPGNQDCVISNPCSRGINCVQDTSLATKGIKHAGLKLDDSLIREIGQTHPRFATMLASINKAGGLKDWTQVHQFAAPVNTADLENWLKPEDEAQTFSREYKRKQVPNAEPVVYEFTLQIIDGTRSVLHGKVIKGFDADPAGTTLEIEFVESKAASWKLY